MTGAHWRCGCALTDLWEADLATLCTNTPGVLHPTGRSIVMCDPGHDCIDVIVHRCHGTNWHTAEGTTVSAWYRRHEEHDPLAGQQVLFEVAS